MEGIHYIIVLFSVTQTFAQFYTDDIRDELSFLDEGPFRNARNPQNAGNIGQRQGVRFGWQNPILVAPTLPPTTGQQRPWNPNPNTPPQRYPPSNSRPNFPDPAYPTTQRYIPQRQPEFTTRTPTPNWGTESERLPSSEAQTQQICPPGSRKGRRNGKCYSLGSTEPCLENMAFYADPSNNEFGRCDCIQNLNRPLVYHPNSEKCYFIFQQAYCQPEEWLVIDPQRGIPFCDINRCISWTQNRSSNWDWTSNSPQLDNSGTVALLREMSCARLGWPCRQEGQNQLRPLLEEENSLRTQPRPPQISLTFSGMNLICGRERSEFQGGSENEMKIRCKSGLINKWRLDGNCN